MMKKLIFILCILIATDISGQTFYPQQYFFLRKSPSVNSKNDVEEYDYLKDELKKEHSNRMYLDKQLIELVYRMYEIERTSQIPYITVDGKQLPFQCNDMPSGVAVDFGASLIANESIVYEDGFSPNILRFGSPVTTIDPLLFSSNIRWIILPATKNLTYKSSPDMWTGNLKFIEGQDVVNRSALITKDKTLIVAATKDKEHFKIPDGVLKIGAGALRGSWSSSIEIPSSVTDIGDKAFDNSLIMHYFMFSETVPSIGEFAFGTFGKIIDENAMLYVPKKILGKYKKTYPDLKNHLTSIEKSKGIYYLCLGKSEFYDGNYAKATELFEMAVKNKCPSANYWLGRYYSHVENDPKKGYSYYEKAAKKKDVESMYMCHFYPRYYSEPTDIDAAIKWLKLAIKNNHEQAAVELGNIFSDTEHKGYPLKLQEALEAYKKVNDYYDLYSDEISRVEQLIKLGADKRITFNVNNKNSFDDRISQFLYSSLQDKQSFCLFDMTTALMNEYDVTEDEALDFCKDLIDQWNNQGIVSFK